MILAIAIFAIVAAVAASAATVDVQVHGKPEVSLAAAPGAGDLCPFCVNAMGQILNELIQIVLQGGVIGSCGELCSKLPVPGIAKTACNLLCDYVGIETFVKLLQREDPDPIYFCQLLDACGFTNGGKADIFLTQSVPKSGAQGTTFDIEAEWRVTKATGPGGLNIAVVPQGGFPITGGSFIDGQQPGVYGAKFSLKTKPSEQEPFNPGVYQVEVALCEGDCTTKHPHGGIYSVNRTSFTITQ